MLMLGIIFVVVGGVFSFVALDQGDKKIAIGLAFMFLIGAFFIGFEFYKDNTTKIVCDRSLVTNEYREIKYNKSVRIIRCTKPCNNFFIMCSGYSAFKVEIINE